jgi:microcystin-dependent protein
MALRQRTYFFDAGNADRFNSQDIPTEQTMSDWCDSVPFIKEITDRAQLTRAGIAKTTTDAKINTGDNVDAAGVSPLGFTSFVRPAQIPKILNSSSITWTKVPRGGATNTDTGVGIEDWRASFDYSTLPDVDTSEVLLDANKSVRILTGGFPCLMTDAEITTNAGDPLNDYLSDLKSAINQANQTIISLSNTVCGLIANADTQVALGDVILTVTPPSYWGTNWAEPLGQSLLIADHPDLYALFLNTYGVAAPGYFKIPDLVQQENYLRAKQTSGGLLVSLTGGQATRTLVESDLPLHDHTVTGNTTDSGVHSHTLPVYRADNGYVVPDGNGGNDPNPPVNYSMPSGGAHTHTVAGTTDDFGSVDPNPVWNIATSVTPRYTNFFLKMRVK